MNALPPEFVAMLKRYPQLDGLAETLAGTAPEVSVRCNALKGVAPSPGADIVPWCASGEYLDRRPAFTFDPRLHQGVYYVQDASSMIYRTIAQTIKEREGGATLRWLDACAAPGGKTTAVVDALGPGSLVHAHEYDARRCAALIENLERLGSPDVVVSRGDTARLSGYGNFYDVISVDAPCSGEGMMRKEPEAVAQWSPGLVKSCAALQREILANVWPALRPGGWLVYSTCTFNTHEDEENVLWLRDELGAEPVDLSLDGYQGVIGDITGHGLPVARFIPGRVRGEGLFVCVLRKPGVGARATLSLPNKFKPAQLPDWLDGDFVGIESDGRLYALPKVNAGAIMAVDSARMRGLYLGERKGRDIVPSQALAQSLALKHGAFPEYEADSGTALSFLRGEALRLDGVPRGFVLLTFGGRPLGFVKNIGNRANNLLPDNRRIISPIPSPVPEPLNL